MKNQGKKWIWVRESGEFGDEKWMELGKDILIRKGQRNGRDWKEKTVMMGKKAQVLSTNLHLESQSIVCQNFPLTFSSLWIYDVSQPHHSCCYLRGSGRSTDDIFFRVFYFFDCFSYFLRTCIPGNKRGYAFGSDRFAGFHLYFHIGDKTRLSVSLGQG